MTAETTTDATTGPEVLVHPDRALLAEAGAARLLTRVADAQAARGHASVVLTGGSDGTALLRAVATSPARDAVDWSRVDLWWGDERFLPEGDPDRNATQAHAVLLDALPLTPARVHPMPAADGPYGSDAVAAAAGYAAELAAARRPSDPGEVPAFDVVLLGVGPDGHVASLFPGLPAVDEEDRPAVAVFDAPKPPPTRITLTLPTLRAAREVWLLAGGEEKAEAVSRGLAGDARPHRVPVAGARGRHRTLWLLDTASAGDRERTAG